MKKYDQIRRKLIDRRDEIRGRLDKVDQDILHTDGAPSPDSGEQAVERENDDVLEALGGLARSELEKINIALERIELGEYGNCTLCKTSRLSPTLIIEQLITKLCMWPRAEGNGTIS